jgi:hypothetical protein
MQADRRYSTSKGNAHAAYDGSTWSVAAHPDNGEGQSDALVFDAWRDEAGFRGRQWLVSRLGGEAIGDGDNDMGAGWATLKAIAEAAIAVAYDRVEEQHERVTYLASVEAVKAADARGATALHVPNGGPNSDSGWVAFTGPGTDGKAEAGVQRLAQSLWGLWGWNPETRQTYLDSTHVTAIEAIEAALDRVAPEPPEPLPEQGSKQETHMPTETTPPLQGASPLPKGDNDFAYLADADRKLRLVGASAEKRRAVADEMTKADYDHLYRTYAALFGVTKWSDLQTLLAAMHNAASDPPAAYRWSPDGPEVARQLATPEGKALDTVWQWAMRYHGGDRHWQTRPRSDCSLCNAVDAIEATR